jgi:prepilin-type N-terminal cleavage/methylation domain-containing protein
MINGIFLLGTSLSTDMKQAGVTLIELMIVIVIITILVVLSIPAFNDYIATQRARGAAEGLVSALQNAKAEAVKSNQETSIIFRPTTIDTEHASTSWCYGMTPSGASSCDCSATPSTCATGSVVDGDDYPNVTVRFNSDEERGFEPIQGDANNSEGTVIFNAGNNKEVGVVLSPVGRVRLCQPSTSTISRYEDNVCVAIP